MSKIEKIYQSGKTVFTIHDLRIIWDVQNPDALKASVKYFVDKGVLQRLKKGVYALPGKYDKFELASKLISPSYISLETVLQKNGIIFQFSSAITSVAAYGRTITIHGQEYGYHSMKKNVFVNPLGILSEKYYMIASPERAICDFIYFYGLSHFDNLRKADKGMLGKISKIYGKKSVEKNIKKLIKTL